MDGAQRELLHVLYHPYVLLHQRNVTPAAAAVCCDERRVEVDEAYVTMACVERRPALERDRVSQAAAAMADLIRACGPDELDVVIFALFHVRMLLQDMGLAQFSHGVFQALHVPLLNKSVWRQRFLAGELDEGTALLSKLLGVFKTALVCQVAMLSTAVSLEHGYWKAHLYSRLIFCTDFDDTCTCEDTTEILVGITNNATHWAHLMEGVTSTEEGHLGQQGSSDNLQATLLSLEEPEKRADEQVMREGLLKGITKDNIKEVAKQQVTLRSNCGELLQRLANVNVPIHVISSNWSHDLIQESLPQHLKQLSIHSNDLQYDNHGVCDGTFSVLVRDSSDKECILRQAVRAAHSSSRSFVVYVGDSINDLLALLEADVGIVIGDDALLQDVMSKHKMELAPLPIAASLILQGVITDGELPSFRQSGKLFHATYGWEDIEQFL